MQTLNIIQLGDIGWAFTDDNIKINDEEHEKALNILLNKLHAEFDEDKLNTILLDLADTSVDIKLTGFDENEFGDNEIDYETIGSSFDRTRIDKTYDKLTCGDIVIELSENEVIKLDAEFEKYLTENTVQFGFLNYLVS